MTDPATLPLLLYGLGLIAVLLVVAYVADRKTRIRPNRRRGMPAPRPDARRWQDEFTRSLRP